MGDNSITDMHDVWRRFRYTEKHRRTLELDVSAWAEKNASNYEGKFNREASRYEYHFLGELPSKRLGLLLGDVLHGYRSTLDNLVHQLLAREGATRDDKAAFRICTSEVGEQAARHQRESKNLRPEDRKILDLNQPWRWRENVHEHPLALLDRFSNADKHRVLLPSMVTHRLFITTVPGARVPLTSARQVSDGQPFRLNIPFPTTVRGAETKGFGPGQETENPRLIYVVELDKISAAEPEVALNRELELHVAWLEGDETLNLDRVREIANTVQALIEDTERTL